MRYQLSGIIGTRLVVQFVVKLRWRCITGHQKKYLERRVGFGRLVSFVADTISTGGIRF